MMASLIFLGGLKPEQRWMEHENATWKYQLGKFRGTGNKAIIAKGNIIEGIEAKE